MSSSRHSDIHKFIRLSTRGGKDDANLLWLQLTRYIHGLGRTEMKAAAVILSMPDESYQVWREAVADRLGISMGYVGVLMNALREKRFLIGSCINKKLALPRKLPVNIMIKIE